MITDGNVHKEGKAISDLALLLDLLAFSLIPASRANSSSVQKDIEHQLHWGVTFQEREGRNHLPLLGTKHLNLQPHFLVILPAVWVFAGNILPCPEIAI
jgi:hypothetical protein